MICRNFSTLHCVVFIDCRMLVMIFGLGDEHFIYQCVSSRILTYVLYFVLPTPEFHYDHFISFLYSHDSHLEIPRKRTNSGRDLLRVLLSCVSQYSVSVDFQTTYDFVLRISGKLITSFIDI